jgi:hypothetical protein
MTAALSRASPLLSGKRGRAELRRDDREHETYGIGRPHVVPRPSHECHTYGSSRLDRPAEGIDLGWCVIQRRAAARGRPLHVGGRARSAAWRVQRIHRRPRDLNGVAAIRLNADSRVHDRSRRSALDGRYRHSNHGGDPRGQPNRADDGARKRPRRIRADRTRLRFHATGRGKRAGSGDNGNGDRAEC